MEAGSRRSLLIDLAQVVGGSTATVIDARDGWPGLIALRVPGSQLRIAAHVGPIGFSHRGRDDVERRFQNPGKRRMSEPPGFYPLLLGLWRSTPGTVVLVRDVLGREVMHVQATTDRVELDLRALLSGTYRVEARGGEACWSRSFVKL